MQRTRHAVGRRLRSLLASLLAALALTAGPAGAQPAASNAATPPAPIFLDQGWSDADRDTFYTTSQGSRIMPYAWFKALRRADVDAPFGDQLQRYGYLANDKSPLDLPVGFVIDGTAATGAIGMTCAACHTAQLEFQAAPTRYVIRLDGAPANADFQSFLADLTAAVRATMASPERFDVFAKAVLGTDYSAGKVVQLKLDFSNFVNELGIFMDVSLPKSPWGPARLDAFGMIFNRAAGLDLNRLTNLRPADAPVSYPFLWNASKQDRTQWNGAAPNGLYVQGLARNTGEVFGVFAKFTPTPILGPIPIPSGFPHLIDYKNSADFSGLQTLEEKIAVLKPPPWPRAIFGLEPALLPRGAQLFTQHCASCHGVHASSQLITAWDTPIKAVQTDPKMSANALLTAETGPLAGSMEPPLVGKRLGANAKKVDILANAVIGSLTQQLILDSLSPEQIRQSGVWRALRKDFADVVQPGEDLDSVLDVKLDIIKQQQFKAFLEAKLKDLFQVPGTADSGAAYEARVLDGIWATAPYLHNGSVPNLWELLKPAKDRMTSFMVGSREFDAVNVGYATDRSPFNFTLVTDPANANGNGNGGHEYGIDLSEADRRALIEYLKTL